MAVTLHTSLGDMKLEVFCDRIPRASENFLALCASGAYDGTIFHRCIPGFIIQGGDPTNTGRGGKSIWDDKFADEFHDTLKHDARGIVSMANSGPDTNGSQFFILFQPQSHLDQVNTIVARVIHGLEVLDAMEAVPVDDKDRPQREIKLERVTIHANPIADKAA